MDGKYLLGGMMIGDTKDYIKLVPMVKNQKPLEMPPAELIIGASKSGDDDGSGPETAGRYADRGRYVLTEPRARAHRAVGPVLLHQHDADQDRLHE